jgi:hypothetical protein
MTINQTAKKLGVSFYDYVYDRVSGRFELPALADLITQKRKPCRFDVAFTMGFKVDTASPCSAAFWIHSKALSSSLVFLGV